MSKKYLPIIIFALVVIIDQSIKIWVKTHLMLEEEYPLLGKWFYIHFTENNGMAFGFEFAGKTGKYILSILRILAVIGLGWLIYSWIKKDVDKKVLAALSFIMAGAFGNIADSALYGMIFTESFGQVAGFVPWGEGYTSFLQGKVVDMFYIELLNFHLPEWFPLWPKNHIIFFRPVFNLADAAITSGIIYLLFFRRKTFQKAFYHG